MNIIEKKKFCVKKFHIVLKAKAKEEEKIEERNGYLQRIASHICGGYVNLNLLFLELLFLLFIYLVVKVLFMFLFLFAMIHLIQKNTITHFLNLGIKYSFKITKLASHFLFMK